MTTPNKHNRNQNGTASIISTLIIVILLSLISVGFAKIMDRSLQNSLDSHLYSAADYVAQSGINDAMAYIKARGINDNTSCTGLSGNPPNGINFTLSTSDKTKYTCILVSSKLTDLVYNGVSPYTSRVATVQGAASLLLSWSSTNNSLSKLPPAGSTQFLDETTWSDISHLYAPVLRVTLYPVINNLTGIVPRTYFLYPSAGGTNEVNYGTTADGSVQPVNCNNTSLIFHGASADGRCNVVISNLNPSFKFYVRLTPLYNQTDLKIMGNTPAGGLLSFTNQQTTIDVTATAGGATKRLVARIDRTQLGVGETPEFALRTTNLLCKRITISTDGLDSLGSPEGCAIPDGAGYYGVPSGGGSDTGDTTGGGSTPTAECWRSWSSPPPGGSAYQHDGSCRSDEPSSGGYFTIML
jgi:hypothetical protein